MYARAVRTFGKFAIKSTIFELQKSYLHIFGVAQNFQFNGGAQKRGGWLPPPPPPLYKPLESILSQSAHG